MRILVCAQQDLVTCVALNRLLPGLGGHTAAVVLKRLPPDDAVVGSPLARQRWFERALTLHEVFPALDRLPHPPGELLTFHHLARRYCAPFHVIERINTGDGYRIVQEFRPDLILSLRFGLIFKEPVLALPGLGVLNVHSGALPQYAGLGAPVHTLLDGERKLTSTLHVVDAGIDTGPVVASADLPVDRARSLFWRLPALYVLGVELFLRVMPGLAKGRKPVACRKTVSQALPQRADCPQTSPPSSSGPCVSSTNATTQHASDASEPTGPRRLKPRGPTRLPRPGDGPLECAGPTTGDALGDESSASVAEGS